ncbi:MAG: DEAD/DEAH box helicase family protein [Bacteroidales bacterium]|nr:DEAD/DEAH box helicase family protein [Bacteroidales bacterium]
MSSTIKFQFEDNQRHQISAIESVVNLFEGLPRQSDEYVMAGDDTIANMPPYMLLEENWLLSNLNTIQHNNGLAENIALDVDEGFILEDLDAKSVRFPVFTIEMETGTGKTYVYLRTIHELKKLYGFRKFVIVVPSIAIYEGTIKTFEVTKAHFNKLYGNDHVHLTRYDGQQISKLRGFAGSQFIEILIITIDSFNKVSNIIFKPTEKLPGEKRPYQYIQETRPILILDESQNYRSILSRSALRTLNPLFAINYSATPVDKPNLVYRLSPVDAFKQNLVKKIEVLGVTEEHNINNPQLRLALESVISTIYGLSAKVSVLVNEKGVLHPKTIEIHKGDSLLEKTKNDYYKNLIVETIDKLNNIVTFSDGSQLSLNEPGENTLSKQEIFRTQISETIRYHLHKQNELLDKGIKVLSLFFIDRVSNYTGQDAIIPKLFDAEFLKLRNICPYFEKLDPSEVREAYFAQKKNKKGETEFVDTNLIEAKKTKAEKELEKAAYELIMKKKEILLSFDEKVSFIFAHSALKEGWDNPNVFQICTLNTTVSETRKRQEIGRGLRLPVNQEGIRITDETVNILTVVANESYRSYVENLQNEYVESGDAPPPAPTDAKKSLAQRNDKIFKSKDFQDFWEKLCTRTTYQIKIDSDTLVKDCITLLNNQQFPEPQIVIERGKFIITEIRLELLEIKKETAKIKVTITDTDNNETSFTRWFKEQDDLYRLSKDEKLKGFKVIEISDKGDDSAVIFADKGKLTLLEPIVFSTEKSQLTSPRTVQEAQTTYPVFNLIDRTAKETQLTRPTILQIFKGMREDKKRNIFKNPESFSAIFITTIQNQLADHIASKIEYILEKGLEEYEDEKIFPKTKKYPQKELIEGTKNSLYDVIQFDSDVEYRFIENKLKKDDEEGNIIAYFKFPNSFKIHMPKIIGNYVPDWGIIRKDSTGKYKLQLVRETKGTMIENLLQYPSEKRKILCAKKHFKTIEIDYKQIDDRVPNWWLPE